MNILSNTHSTKCSRRWRTQNYRMHSTYETIGKPSFIFGDFCSFFFFLIFLLRQSELLFSLVSLSLSLFRKSVVRKSMILPYCVNVNNDLYIFFRLPSHFVIGSSRFLLSLLSYLLPSFLPFLTSLVILAINVRR